MAGDPLKDYTLTQLQGWAQKKTVYAPGLARLLVQDDRKGVQAMGRTLEKRFQNWEDRLYQYHLRRSFDEEYRNLWGSGLLGVDEVGRGPVAGPVLAACVKLPQNSFLLGLNDSKALQPQVRKDLFCLIHKHALAIGVGMASAEEIDELNISRASLLAMERALMAANVQIDGVLVDGTMAIPGLSVPQKTVCKGDSRSLSIAAASIVAKVLRDWLMDCLHRVFPVYNFAEHKGYLTQEHKSALAEYGPCCYHRKTFAPVRDYDKKEVTLFDNKTG